MRVFYWSLIALLTLLFFPLIAWGFAMTGGLGMSAILPVPCVYGGIIGSNCPSIYAVNPNQPLPAENQPGDRKPVPVSHDALPPTTTTEILAAIRSEGQRDRPGEQGTKLLQQVFQGLAHREVIGPRQRQHA